MQRIIIIATGTIVLFVLTAVLWDNPLRTVTALADDLGRLWGAAMLSLIFVVVACLVYFVAKKTLWELLQLLIVPLALAGLGFWFTTQQDARQQQIENRRAATEIARSERRAQDAALQAYLDQMSQLLLDDGLLRSGPDSNVRLLARSQTLTVLTQLQASTHKRATLKFLFESYLIQRDVYFDRDAPYFDPRVPLPEEAVENAPVISLKDAKLDKANLIGSHLLLGADLENARLNEAQFERAYLTNAYLRRGLLVNADFSRAVLDGADFTDATGVYAQELHQEAKSLEGTTMPSGKKYEEWLKDKEGRREGGENSGPS